MLPQKPDNDPFKVPAGYFEQLQEQILARIDETSAPKKKPAKNKFVMLKPIMRYAAGIAASVALFFLFTQSYEQRVAKTAQTQTPDYEVSSNLYMAGMNANEIYEYIASGDDSSYNFYEEN